MRANIVPRGKPLHADNQSDYKVGPGRLPLHTRFKKGSAGAAGSPSARRSSRRWSANRGAPICATKMLIDMMKEVEKKARVAAPSPEPRPLAAADEEVVESFVARLRRQILQEIEEGKTAALLG